eukprot:scaffold13205_cov21-Phaeocystis_antarctica.AAC.2
MRRHGGRAAIQCTQPTRGRKVERLLEESDRVAQLTLDGGLCRTQRAGRAAGDDARHLQP